jgi:hypothetical protein
MQSWVASISETFKYSSMEAQGSGLSVLKIDSFCEIENLMPLKDPADTHRILQTLSKGQAFSCFEQYLKMRLDVKHRGRSNLPDNHLIELVTRDLYIA